MTEKEIVQALRCMATRDERRDCEIAKRSQLGCAECISSYIRDAAAAIERLTAENADLRKEIEWKDMVITLAQRDYAKAESECKALINELCQYCGKYKYAHDGACDGCRWKGET
nr:MAG TPA: hypothetical protein [Bacteriophage sp.]